MVVDLAARYTPTQAMATHAFMRSRYPPHAVAQWRFVTRFTFKARRHRRGYVAGSVDRHHLKLCLPTLTL